MTYEEYKDRMDSTPNEYLVWCHDCKDFLYDAPMNWITHIVATSIAEGHAVALDHEIDIWDKMEPI